MPVVLHTVVRQTRSTKL